VDTFASPAVWAGFVVVILALLGIDLALHRKPESSSMRASLAWTAVWIALGLGFGGVLWAWQGGDLALEYLSGWLVEKSLSVDNVFVFLMLFAALAIPPAQQHRVLFYGVLGAIVLRFVFIVAGAEVLEHFHWVVVPLGAFLAFTGARMLRNANDGAHGNRILAVLRRLLPRASPFFFAVVAIELTDVLFAVDSVPAVFAVTDDPFIVFTSNIFALLGLRSLTFVVADLLPRLRYLKLGLALILIFVGAKLALEPWLALPPLIALAVIAAILASTVGASLRHGLVKPSQPAQNHA
jgi:tellurite resistance protein TerC